MFCLWTRLPPRNWCWDSSHSTRVGLDPLCLVGILRIDPALSWGLHIKWLVQSCRPPVEEWRPEPRSPCQSSMLFFIQTPQILKVHSVLHVFGEIHVLGVSLCFTLLPADKSAHVFFSWVVTQVATWELLLPAKENQRLIWTWAQFLPSQPSLSQIDHSGSTASYEQTGWLTGSTDLPLTQI